MGANEYENAWRGDEPQAGAAAAPVAGDAQPGQPGQPGQPAVDGAAPGPVTEAAAAGIEAAAAAGVDPRGSATEAEEYAKAYDELPADDGRAPPNFQVKDEE